MITAEKTSSVQPHHRDEGALVADAPTTRGNSPDQSPPDVRLQSSELRRIAVDKSADGRSGKEGQAAIEIPVAELRALAKKNMPASRRRSGLRTASIFALSLVPVLFAVGATFGLDKFGLPSLGWLSSTSTTTSSQSDAVSVQAAEQSATKPAEASTQDAPRAAAPLDAVAQASAGMPSYSELEQRIKALADSLVLVQESVDKLAASQQQTALDVATLKGTEKNIEQEPGRKAPSSPVLRPVPSRRDATRIAPPPLPELPPPEPAPGSSAASAPSALPPSPEAARTEPVLRPPMPLRDQ